MKIKGRLLKMEVDVSGFRAEVVVSLDKVPEGAAPVGQPVEVTVEPAPVVTMETDGKAKRSRPRKKQS